jgi:hypothetical protein
MVPRHNMSPTQMRIAKHIFVITRIISKIYMLVIFGLFINPKLSDAQQMFVDDAAVTTVRSFQIESWYGSRESWFLTAVSPVKGLEFGAGFGFDSRDGFIPANWILETKYSPINFDEKGSAFGFVTGILFNFDGEIEEIFAYVPYSRMILDNSSALHFNVGFDSVQNVRWKYELITGIRSDIGLNSRFILLAEIAAVNLSNPFYQGGIRFTLMPGLLEMDVTYGEGFRRQESAPGFNVGISFTPDTLW